MDTGNTPASAPIATSGGEFALGMALGRIETRLAAIETACATNTTALASGLAAINGRLDDNDADHVAFRQAINLLALELKKQFEWIDDAATGDEKLALVDAPDAKGDPGKTGPNKVGAASKGPASMDPGDVQPVRSGWFDASRKVKPGLPGRRRNLV